MRTTGQLAGDQHGWHLVVDDECWNPALKQSAGQDFCMPLSQQLLSPHRPPELSPKAVHFPEKAAGSPAGVTPTLLLPHASGLASKMITLWRWECACSKLLERAGGEEEEAQRLREMSA